MDTIAIPQQLEGLIQLGFAALVAGWLIRWLTSTMTDTVQKNTAAILGLQLYTGELYKLLLSHDLQIRGVNPTAGDDETDAHKRAREGYEAAVKRLDSLTVSIEKVLEKVS